MATTITVYVISPDTRSERRYDLHLTVKQLKTKLESVTGITVDSQIIHVYQSEDEANANGNPCCMLSDDEKALGYYGLGDWQVLKVTDANPSGASLIGQFTDVSQVEKFELTDSEYAQRQDSVLAYKQRNKLGRFSSKDQEITTPTSSATDTSSIAVGSRCEVDVPEDGMKKRGTVRFVGSTKFGKGGVWVGVEYDEPLGKNDGSAQGERYFTCRNSYGAFVRPDKVTVGNFPVQELSLDDDEEM